MQNCSENRRDLIVKIEIIPFDAATWNVPMLIKKSLMQENVDFTLSESDIEPVLMTPGSAEESDSSSDETAGRLRNVEVSFEVSRANKLEYEQLTMMEQNPFHLRITYFGGTRSIVRTDRDSYLFTYSEDKGAIKGRFRIMNISGIQLIG